MAEPSGTRYATIDLLVMLMTTFMALAVIAILIVIVKPKAASPMEGRMVITMHWDHASDSDIDLWVQSPDADSPVGFSHETGRWCDLLRDDLGRHMDPASNNEEMVVCRKPPAGKWIVDVFAYHVYDMKFPITVTIKVYMFRNGAFGKVLSRTLTLTFQGQQATAFQFKVDKALNITDINHLPFPLYLPSGK